MANHLDKKVPSVSRLKAKRKTMKKQRNVYGINVVHLLYSSVPSRLHTISFFLIFPVLPIFPQ